MESVNCGASNKPVRNKFFRSILFYCEYIFVYRNFPKVISRGLWIMVSSNWDHVALFMMGTSVTLLVFSHFQQRFLCVSLLHSNTRSRQGEITR